MKKLLLTILLFSSVYSAFAQLHGYKWRLGISSGTTNYYGDIQPFGLESLSDLPNWYKRHQNYAPEWSYQASLEYALSPSIGLKLSAGTYQFGSADRFIQNDGTFAEPNQNFDRALNFQTRLMDAGLSFVIKPDNNWLLSGKSFFAPYLTFGAGIQQFNVRGDLLDEDGNRYDYSNNQPQVDGEFETELRPLNTERETAYRNLTPYANFGMGLRFRLTPQFELFAQSTFNYAFTDYLDDVSGRYQINYESSFQQYAARPGENRPIREQPYRGNPDGQNDWYIYHGVGIKFSFGAKKQSYRFPVISQRYQITPEKIADKFEPKDSADTTVRNDSPIINNYYTLIQIPSKNDKKTSIDSTKLKEKEALLSDQDSLIYDRDSISASLDSLVRYEKLIMTDTLIADSLKQLKKDSLANQRILLEDQINSLDSLKSQNDSILTQFNFEVDSLIEDKNEENLLAFLDSAWVLKSRNTSTESSSKSKSEYQNEMISRSELESELNNLRVEMLEAQAKRDSALIVAISNMENQRSNSDDQETRAPDLIRETFSEKETRYMERDEQEEARQNRILRDALLVGGAAAATSAVRGDDADSIRVQTEYVILDSLLLSKIQRDSILIDSLKNRPARTDTVVQKVRKNTLFYNSTIDVYFEINQNELGDGEKEKIEDFLTDIPEEESIQIELKGFADNTGSVQYNLNLIAQRVQSVKNFLTEELEIDADKISIAEGGLIQRGRAAGSRDEDRRVEIRVFKDKK
ncbi:OmpA family protein [Algoriphagus hitonicola]|uniref:OmpA family protein n=1 Tax=Algoriphagus hitonicola TaxID=435880 RepID=A0A1I2TLE3_9BACT|nr:OmpA family protein [Algoriphagus hitonicola]SFG65633.1 OmpA family protein [Algoriphagus hitonicola]